MKVYINKRSLSEEVAAKLQEQISLGHYKVNEKLPIEPELMKSFGVGRSSIREAIKLLTNAGLLRVQQGVGTFVEQTGSREPMDLRLKRADVNDLDEVRQLLEIKVAEKAALNRSAKDIEAIGTHLNDRRAAAENNLTEECIEADIRFHVSIAEASGNEILADLYRSASVHLKDWFKHIYHNTTIFKETQGLHEQLLRDIIAGDPKKAWATASEIIGNVSQ